MKSNPNRKFLTTYTDHQIHTETSRSAPTRASERQETVGDEAIGWFTLRGGLSRAAALGFWERGEVMRWDVEAEAGNIRDLLYVSGIGLHCKHVSRLSLL
jgi:hypothetical protein